MAVYYKSKNQPKCKVRIKHELECVSLVFQAITNYQPEIFIELGTLYGGFTLALNEHFPELEIFTFDKDQRKNRNKDAKALCSRKVRFVESDLLNGDCRNLIDLLGGKKRKILYCDNGNKFQEMKKFAGYLNPGDLIGVHDWLTRPHVSQRGEEYQVKRLKKDGVLEDTAIVDEYEIEDLLKGGGFEKYMWELFEQYPLREWVDEKGKMTNIWLTDPRAASRFWIKTR